MDTQDILITQTDDAQHATIHLRDNYQPTKNLILGAFTHPGQAYFERMEAIKIDISLNKIHITTTLKDYTNVTKERLDVETSVDRELLDKIIRKEITAKTQNIIPP